jgi:hypothetical protein
MSFSWGNLHQGRRFYCEGSERQVLHCLSVKSGLWRGSFHSLRSDPRYFQEEYLSDRIMNWNEQRMMVKKGIKSLVLSKTDPSRHRGRPSCH